MRRSDRGPSRQPHLRGIGSLRRAASAYSTLLGLGVLLVIAGCADDRSPSAASGEETLRTPPVELPDAYPGELPDSGGPGGPGAGAGLWVRLRLFGPPDHSGLGLWILRGGQAAAVQCPGGLRTRAELEEETLRRIAGWFDAAAFTDASGGYLSERPSRTKMVEVCFQPAPTGPTYGVRGELTLVPERVRWLVGQLETLATEILATGDSLGLPPPPPPPPPPHRTLRGDLSLQPVEGATGTARTITLRLHNAGVEPATLTFRSGQLYDFVLLDPRGAGGDSLPCPPRPLWRWSTGMAFPALITTLTLAPGEIRLFEEVWPGQTDRGDVVGAGVYVVEGRMLSDRPVEISPVRLRVTR